MNRADDAAGEPAPFSRSPEALAAYEAQARAGFAGRDPRDQHTYMISKLRTDYTLLERVGVKDRRVLNVGCSFPVDEIHFARKVASWTAIDISRESLRVAEEISRRELPEALRARLSFRYADACALPFDAESFDVCAALSTIDHLPSSEARQRAVDEMARVTVKGGWVVLTVPNRWDLPYAAGVRTMRRRGTLSYGYVHLFSPREARRMGVRAGLRPVHFASSVAAPEVWLPGYPFYVRYPAALVFGLVGLAGYFGRRVGYAFRKDGG